MSLLGMRRAPELATLSVALSLVGWIPWSALIALDDLAYEIAQAGSPPELGALWLRFNGDPVMVMYLLIYIIGHLLSANRYRHHAGSATDRTEMGGQLRRVAWVSPDGTPVLTDSVCVSDDPDVTGWSGEGSRSTCDVTRFCVWNRHQ